MDTFKSNSKTVGEFVSELIAECNKVKNRRLNDKRYSRYLFSLNENNVMARASDVILQDYKDNYYPIVDFESFVLFEIICEFNDDFIETQYDDNSPRRIDFFVKNNCDLILKESSEIIEQITELIHKIKVLKSKSNTHINYKTQMALLYMLQRIDELNSTLDGMTFHTLGD